MKSVRDEDAHITAERAQEEEAEAARHRAHITIEEELHSSSSDLLQLLESNALDRR